MKWHVRLFAAIVLALSAVDAPLAEDGASGALVTLGADVTLAARESFEFDATGPGIDLGSSAGMNVGSGDFTVSARVLFWSLTNESGPCSPWYSGCDMALVDKMADYNTNGWRLLKQSNDAFWFCLGAPDNGCAEWATSTTIQSGTTAVPLVWYTVTGVKTATSISYLSGQVAEVMLFKRALTSGQVLALHHAAEARNR